MLITTVRMLFSAGAPGGGGCGTRASRPFGVSGVITMKMMISTSSTSIMGVMLMSDFGPPVPPTAIDIRLLLFENSLALHRSRGRLLLCLDLVRQEAQLVHAGRLQILHHIQHAARN